MPSPSTDLVAPARHLLVRAGGDLCALPLERVRRIVRELPVTPLAGASGELKGLAELGGEPLPVLDLMKLVGAPLGPHPPFPLVVVVWVGPAERPEVVGLAVDAALEVVMVAPDSVVGGSGGGWVRGEASVGGRPVRVVALATVGAP